MTHNIKQVSDDDTEENELEYEHQKMSLQSGVELEEAVTDEDLQSSDTEDNAQWISN